MRERRMVVAAVAAVLLVAAGMAVWRAGVWGWLTGDAPDTVEGWATRLQSIADEIPGREVEVRATVSESRSTLVVFGDGEDDAAFTLFAVSPDGEASLTIIPQRMLAPVPGYGEFRLDQALAFEGPELAELSIINRFGIRIDDIVALRPGDLAAAIGLPLLVDVPSALFTQGDDGTQRIVGAGQQAVDPVDVELLLTTPGAGDVFDWLQRQGAVWRSILQRMTEEPDLADRLAAGSVDPTEVADVLLTVAASPEQRVATIPVETASGSGGDTVFVPSEGAATFVEERFGHLILREDRPSVEVLNGNGRIGTTSVVAGNLVRLGFKVVRTDNADRFDYEETEVISQGRKGLAAAREVYQALGTGAVYLELRAPSAVIDVTIIVGQDIPSGEG